MVSVTSQVVQVLAMLGIAVSVRYVFQRVSTVPYTVVLVLAGFGLTLLDAAVGVPLTIRISEELILFVFIPAIVFQGAAEIEFEKFRANYQIPVPMVLVGLPVGVVLIGLGAYEFMGLPFFVAMLFGAIIYPIDPVAVLSLYREMGAPERLAVLTESESLLDDGLAIIIFSTVLGIVREVRRPGVALADVLTLDRLVATVWEFLVVSLGGIATGLVVGYVVYRLIRGTDERLTQFLFTVIAAYASFVVADHFFGVNGILATVTVGVLLGTTGREYAVGSEPLEFVRDVWEAIVFLANTVLFLLIGLAVPAAEFVRNVDVILLGVVLVLAARAVVVYSITLVTNQFVADPVPLSYRHVLVWGALHAAIPIALVLAVPADIPLRSRLRALVFGIVVTSIVIQGLLMPYVLRWTGVVDSKGDGTSA